MFTLTSENGENMAPEIAGFVQFIGLDRAAPPQRYSILLALALFGGYKSGMLNPAKVVTEIEALEDKTKRSHLKPSEPFRHPPLQGLWHKHYLEGGLRSIAANIKKELDRDEPQPFFKRRMRAVQKSRVMEHVTPDDMKIIVDDMVQGAWKRLAAKQALTGEWIIFAKHGGKNYYLCLAQHDDDHSDIRHQIESVCCAEFPFLAELLPDRGASE